MNTIVTAFLIMLLIPVTGAVCSFLVTGLLGVILGIVSPGGTLFFIFCNLLTFPGVVLHEAAHATAAALTGAKVREIRFFSLDTFSLGYVTYTPRGPKVLQALQVGISSCAPVFVGMAVDGYLLYLFMNGRFAGGPSAALFAYLFISVLIHMDMSIVDLIAYLKVSPICFIVLAVVIKAASFLVVK